MARVRPCMFIIELGNGHRIVCGRHTRNPQDRCQEHRPPPATKQPRQPVRPGALLGDYETPATRPDGRPA